MTETEILKQIINKLYQVDGDKVRYNEFYFIDDELVDLLKQLNKE